MPKQMHGDEARVVLEHLGDAADHPHHLGGMLSELRAKASGNLAHSAVVRLKRYHAGALLVAEDQLFSLEGGDELLEEVVHKLVDVGFGMPRLIVGQPGAHQLLDISHHRARINRRLGDLLVNKPDRVGVGALPRRSAANHQLHLNLLAARL